MSVILQPSDESVNNRMVVNDGIFTKRIARSCGVGTNGRMFGEKFRALLKSKGRSQTELACAMGTSQQVISKWLARETPPKLSSLKKIAAALGVPLEDLIDLTEGELDVDEDLREGEVTVLTTFRALRLDVEEAIRRLHGEEVVVVTTVRALGLDVEEAVRRLHGEIAAGPVHKEPEIERKAEEKGDRPGVGRKKKGAS